MNLTNSQQQTETLMRECVKMLRPPPDLTVSEWAETYRQLPTASGGGGGKWRNSIAPFQKGIMDAITDPAVREVYVRKPSQVGWTEILNNAVGYFAHQRPMPMLMMQPTLEMGESWSKDRLAQMIRDTDALQRIFPDPKSRGAGNTIRHKEFPGGYLVICGANSPASLASRPIPVVLLDEIDRYPPSAGTEGDPMNLARARQRTFYNRKTLGGSTPTIKGVSRIDKAVEDGDCRVYKVPCPECGELHELKWEQLDFKGEGSVENPLHRCPHCGHLTEDSDKYSMMAQGQWVAQNEFHGVATFSISGLMSPWMAYAQLVEELYKAKKGGPELIKTWRNTCLGESYEESGETISHESLEARSEDTTIKDGRTVVPDDALVLTFGADVQDDRIELELVGWGEGEESWSITYEHFHGATNRPAVWEKLDEFLGTTWTRADGTVVPCPIGIIDSGDGDTTTKVYDFCQPRMGHRRGVLPGKGANVFSAPIWTAPSKPKRGERDQMKPYMIGVSQIKLVIMSRLKLTEPGPGYMHFPSHYDEHYFKGLTSEKLITRYDKGFPRKEWHKLNGRRNEPLDCRVYAYAALKILNPDFDAIKAKLEHKTAPIQQKSGEKPAKTGQKQRKLRRKKPAMRVKMR